MLMVVLLLNDQYCLTKQQKTGFGRFSCCPVAPYEPAWIEEAFLTSISPSVVLVVLGNTERDVGTATIAASETFTVTLGMSGSSV